MNKLLFIDVETTGLDPEINGVIQIAGIIELNDWVMNGKKEPILQEFDFQCNVHEGDEFDPQALLVTGKTLDDIFNYDPAKVIHAKLTKELGKYVNPYNKKDKYFFVAYNAGFDMDFLGSWFKKCGDKYGIGSWCWFPYVDIMTLAMQYIGDGRASMLNFKLSTVAEKLGLKLDEADLHDALYDIRLARRVYRSITKNWGTML